MCFSISVHAFAKSNITRAHNDTAPFTTEKKLYWLVLCEFDHSFAYVATFASHISSTWQKRKQMPIIVEAWELCIEDSQ